MFYDRDDPVRTCLARLKEEGNPCKPESVFSDMVILEDVIIVIMTDVI